MLNNLAVTGIGRTELSWVRMLISLLRHPDPRIPELTRQALIYVADNAAAPGLPVLNMSELQDRIS
jgi:hypothetical protein